MSLILYNIFLWLFGAGTRIASLFNGKAKKWVQGRKGLFTRLAETIPSKEKIIWMHCASLGEFEQGRPVIEQLRIRYPGHKLLLTFFSPSGYEVRKKYEGADWVFYLPLDGPRNAKRFLAITNPVLVIFVKYEFWYYYLKKIKYREIPLLLISALFRKDMSFFKWYGGIQRKILSRFDRLFVQDASSWKLLDEIGLGPITSISGDTRFDRVQEIAGKFEPIPAIENFIRGAKAMVAGSTWPEDEDLLEQLMKNLPAGSLKLIIAPHELYDNRLASLQKKFPSAVLFSELSKTGHAGAGDCLIIDNFGMLARLYNYGYLTYVGGGLKKMGVHNVLEAAVYAKPVLMGPYYHKYIEAVGLVKSKGGIEIANAEDMTEKVNLYLSNNDNCYTVASDAAGHFIQAHAGATQRIIDHIQENRLLTS